MWLADHQMNLEASEWFGQYFARLPLTKGATIIHGNAHRIDWESVVPKGEISYIMGNPPFVGHQNRNAEQQEDMRLAYKGDDKFGKLDYVCSWYKKSADYMAGTRIQAAFVSTNSICQGESVSTMWEPLFAAGIEATFAYHSFLWSNEAKGKAAVYCVIIGFAYRGVRKDKTLYIGGNAVKAKQINGYLMDAPVVFIQSRGKPLAGELPTMSKGSQPTDGGNLILSESERSDLVTAYPQTKAWIKRYVGAEDYINNIVRYCLWLKDVAPSAYRAIPSVMERLKLVKEMRSKSPTASVRRDAETPMLFTQIRQPDTDYLVIPEVSSERRKYIPIGYMKPRIIAANTIYIVSDATLYMFGIMTSSVHMAWTRVVCGRLKSDYRYTPAVYNNFPWPDATGKHKSDIANLAQGVLDARTKYPDNSLADLYDPLTMPPDLLKAHKAIDAAVMKLYGFSKDADEPAIVAALMELYQQVG